MTLRVKEYETLDCPCPEGKDEQVRNMLRCGWEVFGPPAVYVDTQGKPRFVQTMVVYKTMADLTPPQEPT